jgi:ribonucleoside-diphosphate reductase alpha chain
MKAVFTAAYEETAAAQRQQIQQFAAEACAALQGEGYTSERLLQAGEMQLKGHITVQQALNILIRTAVELTSVTEPKWQYVAGRLLAISAYREAAANRGYSQPGYGDFYGLIVDLTEKGLYGRYILEGYTPEEIGELGRHIRPERDHLFNYNGLKLLLERYVIRGHNKEILELPQEMFMGIAMHLALAERNPADKMKWAKTYYDLASTLRFTFATPTLSGARKPHHQLSSCFVDTVGDSLKGIYASITNFAEVSKNGGGMGLYFGKVRGRASSIRNTKGVSKGIIPWIKLANDTCVSVDQLGQRNGSCSVWTDIWHIDLPDFLKLKTNSGDDRAKAHDVFPGVCVPDLFWKMAAEDMNQTWYLFCPYEIETHMGFRLEDAYGAEWEEKYRACIANPNLRRVEMTIKDIVRLMITSQLETGTPFVMNRDRVNEMQPCGHLGLVRSSNLCCEILQNMSAQEFREQRIVTEDGDAVIVTQVKAGDFVVCNLSSLVVSRNLSDQEMEECIMAQMRAMDAVIDLNEYPLPQAEVTNKTYRAVGLGTMGYHHALALQGIAWESEEHLKWADEYYEKFAFYAIKASMELSKERGPCPAFYGSDWQTGAYFDKRGLRTRPGGPDWDWLKEQCRVHGVRNAYMMAVAPNGSTSVIAGTSASIDPIMDKYWLEEKKGMTIPQTAPDLNEKTYWYYKEAHRIDQMYSIRANAVRQKYIDQGQSFNLYVDPEQVTLRTIFNYYYEAWRLGVKTVYYVRSRSLSVDECQSCSA